MNTKHFKNSWHEYVIIGGLILVLVVVISAIYHDISETVSKQHAGSSVGCKFLGHMRDHRDVDMYVCEPDNKVVLTYKDTLPKQ